MAGITVGIVALPLALAFGASSGAGAASGLITAIVAGAVAAIFGGSNVQVSGPTGAMVVVLGPIIAAHGVGVLAVVCALAGVILVAAGALRLGRAVAVIPWPVIEGFTAGIAIIIALQQVPAMLGAAAGPSSNALIAAVESVAAVEWRTVWMPLLIVAVVVVTMLVMPRLHRAIPGSIVAIVVVTVAVSLWDLPVATIGALPDSLPAPRLPIVEWATLPALLGPAFAIAALAAIESLLSVRVAASIADTGPYDADRELVGQGLASLASGVFGGMPATGAIARTAVSIRAGAQTRLAALVHVLVLVLVVYVASGVVGGIPLAALSGVLIVTAARMVSLSTLRTIAGSSRADAAVLAVTATITVSVDLIAAVGIGIVVAAFFALRSLARSAGVQRETLPGAAEPGDERIALMRLDGALFFGVAERVLGAVGSLDGVSVVILRMSQIQVLDATGAQVVVSLTAGLERRGVTVLVKGIRPEHARLASRVGVVASLRHPEHLFSALDAAVAHARSHVRREAGGRGRD